MGNRIDRVQTTDMRNYANQLKSLIEEWAGDVDDIYTLQQELDNMWSGTANEEFNKNWTEYRIKFKELQTQLESYQAAVIRAADAYDEAEDSASNIIRSSK